MRSPGTVSQEGTSAIESRKRVGPHADELLARARSAGNRARRGSRRRARTRDRPPCRRRRGLEAASRRRAAISRTSIAGSGLAGRRGVRAGRPSRNRPATPLASRIIRENARRLVRGDGHRDARGRRATPSDLRDAREKVRLGDGDLGITLAKEPHALGGAIRGRRPSRGGARGRVRPCRGRAPIGSAGAPRRPIA